MFKERKKGVTIVALVVTIVVLLLLAGVTISVLFGENGLISKAKQASKEYESASHNEANFINFLQNYVTSIGGGSSSSNSSGEENNSSSGGNESGGEGENWKDIEILYEPTTPRNTSNGPDRYGIARGPITVTLKYGNTNLINRSRYQYKIGNGIWQDAAQTYVMEITENTQIKARYFDGTIGYKETSINITNVDNKGPNNFIPQITNTTTKEITVKGEAIDPSGIKGYCFSKDDGAHWTELQESNTYTFEELTTGSYYLRIKAIDRAGNDTVTEPINASTMTVPTAEGNIELTQSWENEVASVALKQNITGYNMQYRIGENGEWKNYEKPVNAELNQKVYARLSDGINYGKEIYLQIKDELRPTAPDIQVTSGIQGQNNWYTGEVTLKIKNGTDSESGVEKTTYQVTGVGAISETTIPTDGVIKITADGISTVTCYTYDKAGNKSPASTMEIKKDAVAPVVSLAVTSTTTNSITVKATANDVSSGLAKKDTYQYYYKKASDGQYTLAKTTSESNFTYEGLEQTTQYHMYVVAYDEAGLKTQSANAVQVTGTVPDGAGNITLTPKWNQGNCYVTAETTTQYSIQYQIGETSGTWKEYKNSVEVDLNQTIYVRLWDGTNGGNTASLKVVDSTAPSVPKIEVLSGSLGENNWYTSNVEIKITAGEDTQSGVTKTTYQVIGAGEKAETIIQSGGTFQITAEGNATIRCYSYDRAGNRSEVAILALKKDTVPPIAPNLTNSSNQKWSNQDIAITMTSQDNTSGIASYEWFENNNWTTRAIEVQNRVGTITYTAERDLEIRFRAKDEAGNYSEESKTFVKIDKTKPAIFTPTAKATTNSITIEGQTTDALSGIKGYCFSKDNGNTWTELQTETKYLWEGLTQNTEYILKMKAIDQAGNEVITDGISKTTSTVPDGIEHISLTPNWENGNCKVTLASNQTGYMIQYQIGGTTGSWIEYKTPVDVKLNQTIYARLWDGTNGGSTASLKVTDTTAPTAPNVGVSAGTAGSNGWYKSDVTVKVTEGTDSQTGIDRTVYSVTGTAKTTGKIGETTIEAGNVNIGETIITSGSTFQITTDGTFTITTYSYDKAGNKSAMATLVVKKDATPPESALAAISTTTKSITVKATASDNTSGLANNTYQYYYKKQADSNYVLATTTKEATYTYDNLLQTTTYQLYVVVTDNAGLSKQSNIVSQATGTVPSGIGNVTLTPSWSAGACKVTLATSQSGYTIQYQVGGTTSTWTTYSSPVTVALNQTIYARLWDGTNGGSTASLKVTDTTAPTIPKVEVTAGTAGLNNWYTSDVTVKVTSGSDTQTGVEKTTYAIKGTAKAPGKIGNISVEIGEVNIPETTITSGSTFQITTDGTFTITSYSYDKAGNKSVAGSLEIKKDATVPTASITVNSTNTKSITVRVAASDATSGLASTNTYKYYYKTAAASTYTLAATSTSNTYTYENLLQTTTYQLYVIVSDNAGLTTQTATINQATGTVPDGLGNVTLTPNWNAGTCKVTLATGQTGYTIQYQVGGTTGTWTAYTLPVTVGLNQTIYARLWDGTNGGSTASLKVTDTTAPTTPKAEITAGTAGSNGWYKSNVTVKVTAGTDTQTGVDRTTYILTGATSKAETEISNLGTFSITGEGTTNIVVYTYDKAGNKSAAGTLSVKKDTVAPTVSLAISNTTTNSIKVKTTANDVTSGLANSNTYQYYYKKQAEANYTLAMTTTSDTYTYNNLSQTTAYDFYVKVSDNAGWSTQNTIINQATGTVPDGLGNVTLTPSWSAGACKVTLATSQSGYTIQYQVGGTAGNWTTYSSPVAVALNQTIYARLWDGTNGGSTASLKVTDTTAPTAPNVGVSAGTAGSNGWYKSDVTVKVTAGTDSQTGVDRTTYTLTGAQTLTETTIANGGTFTITADGTTTITCYTYDKAGNKSAAGTLTLKKDTVAPVASLAVSSTTTKSIAVKVTASDGTSGLASSNTYKYYYKTEAASTYTLAATTTANTYTYNNLAQTTTYNLYVIVTDNAGLTVQSTTINQATGTVPNGSGNITLTPSWSAGACKVTLATSQSGYTIQYQVGGTAGNWTTYSSPVAVALDQTIYARLWDGTNGGSTASLKVTDTTAPTVPTASITAGTAGSNGWYKSNITVKVTAGTDSQTGVDRTTYTLTGAQTLAETTIANGGTFTITADGTTTVTCYTYDKAGNKSAAGTLTLKKDATAPAVSLAVSSTTTKSIAVKVTASDGTSGLAGSNTYKYYYKTAAASTYTLAATTTANTYTYNNLDQTTTYNLYVIAMDNAGWSTQSTTINQATGTVPAGSGNITFTPSWSAGACKVTLATSQSGFTIQYQVGGTSGTWNTYNSAVAVALNQTIYARLTDGRNVGSTGSLKVTDTTAPTAPSATVAAGTVGSNSWYTSNVTIKVTAGTDSQSGVNRTTYSLTGAQALAETAITSGGTFTITADGTTTVTCYTYDNAGNKSTAKTLTIKKDASAPSVASTTVSGGTAGTNGYYKSNVTVKITAGSDGHSGVSKVTYSLSGAQSAGETTITSGGTLTISAEGNTTVTCYTYNGAGIRSSAATLVVKKDATAPIADTAIAGSMLYTDPTFKSSSNGMAIYNNSGNGTVSVTRKAMSDSPTGSGYGVEVKTTGTASPGFGGFTWGTATAANKVYITRIIAKIPSGRNINFATNATGTGGSSKWLTSQAGTGAWKEYIFQLNCGSSGTFSSTNYFYLSGGSTPTTSAPLTWQVAYATVYDTTKWGTSKNTVIKATDNIGVVGYGINQSSTTQPSFTTCSSTTSIATQIENQTANGTYYLWVKDIAGNVSNKSFTVSYIDRTAPTATISPNGGGYVLPTGKTTATIKTRLSATDTGGAGLSTVQYAWSTSNSTEPTAWTNFTATGQDITKTDATAGNWYLWTRVIDVAGNRASSGKVSSAFNVISSSITLTPNTTAYTNGTVTVTVGYGTYLTQNRKAGLGSASTANATSVTITQNGTVYAEATDVAGNKVTASRAITNKIIVGMTMPQNMTFTGSTTGTYSNPIIPKGFAAINQNGANWGTSDGYTKGLVIQDQTGASGTNGSQFVWIPVSNYSNFVRKAGYYNGASDTAVNSCKEADLSSTYATTESKTMHNSVKTNGGFYMARYEAGVANGMSAPSADTTATYANGNYKPVSKAGVNAWNFIKWGAGSGASDKLAGNDTANGAVKAARGMYTGNSATTVHATLTYGVQWDAAMSFLSDITNTSVSKPFIQNSNGMGIYNTQAVATTGKYVTKNIYDLGGNVNEWTMEGYSTTDRVFRGGYYYDAGGVRPASVRCYGLPNGYGGNVGFRVSLYI